MKTSRKAKTAFFCSQCGAEHPKWQGQCRECAAWNSLIEEKARSGKVTRRSSTSIDPQALTRISHDSTKGYVSGVGELDRVLGGQLLPGMTVLIGGEPGIGKSTLLLQAADAYSRQGLSVLYVTGEESLSQLKRRAERLGVDGERVAAVNATNLEEIVSLLGKSHYAVVLIDSIQTVSSDSFDSPPGTVAQVREAANQLVTLAKATGFALILVGHVTKEGMVAGPKVLEHIVDTVIYFEGDSSQLYRVLRVTKNRYRAANEMGLFQMNSSGLTEVTNPSSFFLSDDNRTSRVGSVVAGVCEGHRPLMIDVQALVTTAAYGNPQRVAGGIDNKKLSLLLAVLEKRCDYPMATNDVFVSVAGGLRLSEPALDLPLLVAIVSSLMNRPVDGQTLVVGEVGLSGEVRAIAEINRLASEAAKLGFRTMVLPEANLEHVTEKSIELIGVKDIQTALDKVIG
ncbi:MAG: DNA repair protein RadA [Candidatus Zixiibacteriota bacterium]|nr:MAG: DNA repair protein RadA [candidate division Zixibacteria bacterium]